MFKQKALLVAVSGLVLVMLGYATIAASAQGPATPPAPDGAAAAGMPAVMPPVGPGGPGRGALGRGMDMQGLMAISACSATDNTDVVAKALSMTAADLRVALVSGKTIQDLATAKNVTTDALRTALRDAQKAQVAQAAKDGVITQAQADFITGLLDRVPATRPAAPQAQGTPQAQGIAPAPSAGVAGDKSPRPLRTFPSGAFGPGFGFGSFGIGVSPYVTVNNYVVAAKAINISCAALLVATQQGHQSIAQVAESKSVTAQTVIDALVKAHTDALTEDVKEGLITSAEQAGRSTNLTAQLTAFVNNTGRRTSIFGRFFQGQGVPRGNRGGQARPGNPSGRGPNRNGGQPEPGNAPMVPTAAVS